MYRFVAPLFQQPICPCSIRSKLPTWYMLHRCQIFASIKWFVHVKSFIRWNHFTLVFHKITTIFHVCKLEDTLDVVLVEKCVVVIRLFDNLLVWISFNQMIRRISNLLILKSQLLNSVFITWKVKVTRSFLSVRSWLVFLLLFLNYQLGCGVFLLAGDLLQVFNHVWVHADCCCFRLDLVTYFQISYLVILRSKSRHGF